MNINQKLIRAAEFNPTEKSHKLTVLSMCQQIEKQQITLPLYQRDMSWNLHKCISLLNYQLLGKAPVSPLSVNAINDLQDYVPQVSFITREIVKDMSRTQISIVDGQQRLTTNYKAYTDSEDFRNIVLDLIKGRFLLVHVGGAHENAIIGAIDQIVHGQPVPSAHEHEIRHVALTGRLKSVFEQLATRRRLHRAHEHEIT